MKILIINGPNLNLLGRREPGIYGSGDFDSYLATLRAKFPNIEIDYFQSNIEGEIIDRIQAAGGAGGAGADAEAVFDGILLNAGGYTHTSVSIADAISGVEVPVVEVHISNILAREDFRHTSLLSPVCRGSVMGFGLDSYRLGLLSFLK